MQKLLWLDDIRNPFINEENKVPKVRNGERYDIIWVLNYEQFVKWINLFGLPDVISFDHDLADEHYTPEEYWSDYENSKEYQENRKKDYQEKTGMDCAKWLVDYCIDNEEALPEFLVHSANPVGADNIRYLLTNFKKYHKIKTMADLVVGDNFEFNCKIIGAFKRFTFDTKGKWVVDEKNNKFLIIKQKNSISKTYIDIKFWDDFIIKKIDKYNGRKN